MFHYRSTIHTTQTAALLRILDLAICFPLARECFGMLGAAYAIEQIGTDVFARSCNTTFVGDDTSAERSDRFQSGIDDATAIEAAQCLALLRRRCLAALGENEMYTRWRAFFLSGDAYEREKCVLQLLASLEYVVQPHLLAVIYNLRLLQFLHSEMTKLHSSVRAY